MTATVLAEPHTPEWYEQRRKGIGASEIAAVLGISPWESPLSLYWRKVEGWQTNETEQMSTGTFLEPAIADWGARAMLETVEPALRSWYGFVPGSLMAHPNRPWELATPDRVIEWGIGFARAVLECKWTGSWDGWGDEGTDQIPVHYRAQVLWQCDVVGVDQWYVAVLGPSGFRLYSGHRDDRDIAVMVEAGRRFMARIEAGDPPPIDDHHATVDALKRLHPSLVDLPADVPEDVARGYERAVYMERLAKRAKDRYEAQLRDAMGDCRTAYRPDGRKVATRVVTDVAESTVTRAAHRRDYLLAPREKKS